MTIEQKELAQIAEQFKSATDEVKGLKAKHEEEVKTLGEATAETKSAIEKLNGEIETQFKAMDDVVKELQAKMARPNFGKPEEAKSMGQQFVASDVFAEMKSNRRGSNEPVEIKADITSLAASAGALIDPYRDPEVYRTIGGRRQMRIRDLIPTVPAASGSVEIMRQNALTNAAAPQGSVAGQGGGEFVAKAESTITWELVTVPVRTIAHWVPASRQALSDAPMLQGLIDTELTYGLQLEADNQILNGDGTGQEITGILADAAINDVGELASGTAAADVPAAMIDHIRAAITLCQTSEYYDIDGLILNPTDFATLETAKATDGHYILMPFAATSDKPEQIWRVPVIVSNAMPADTFLLGSWQMGAKLYVNEGVSVRVSESHSDYFVKNGVAVLAEERYCLGINRPKAFTKGLFTVAA